MKWVNMPDGRIVRIDEQEDDLFTVWFFDLFEWLMPKFLRRQMMNKQNKQSSTQTTLLATEKEEKKKVVVELTAEQIAERKQVSQIRWIKRAVFFSLAACFVAIMMKVGWA